mgnify:CR=1 FL=1
MGWRLSTGIHNCAVIIKRLEIIIVNGKHHGLIYIDEIFDPFIRSETMIDVIQKNLINKSKFLKQNMIQGETYFIIHPVLKHISIMNCVK